VGISTPFIPTRQNHFVIVGAWRISTHALSEGKEHIGRFSEKSVHLPREAFCSLICKYVPFLTHNFHLLVISSQKRFVFPPPFQSVFTPLPAYQRRGCQTKTLSNQVYVYLAVRLNILEKKSKQETIAPQCLQMITLVITMKSML